MTGTSRGRNPNTQIFPRYQGTRSCFDRPCSLYQVQYLFADMYSLDSSMIDSVLNQSARTLGRKWSLKDTSCMLGILWWLG